MCSRDAGLENNVYPILNGMLRPVCLSLKLSLDIRIHVRLRFPDFIYVGCHYLSIINKIVSLKKREELEAWQTCLVYKQTALKLLFYVCIAVLNQLLQLCTAQTAWFDSVFRTETSLITESDQ